MGVAGSKHTVRNMAEVKELIDMKIGSKKVMVFSKSYCPFCAMAKDAFKAYVGNELDEADYEVMEIENRSDVGAIQDYLAKLTGARSVPRVFIRGKCVGGGTEVQALHKKGQLAIMLA